MDAQFNCPQYSGGIWRKTGFSSYFCDFPPDISRKFGRKLHACRTDVRTQFQAGVIHSRESFHALFTKGETRTQSISSAGYGRKSVFRNSGSNRFGSSHSLEMLRRKDHGQGGGSHSLLRRVTPFSIICDLILLISSGGAKISE